MIIATISLLHSFSSFLLKEHGVEDKKKSKCIYFENLQCWINANVVCFQTEEFSGEEAVTSWSYQEDLSRSTD